MWQEFLRAVGAYLITVKDKHLQACCCMHLYTLRIHGECRGLLAAVELFCGKQGPVVTVVQVIVYYVTCLSL